MKGKPKAQKFFKRHNPARLSPGEELKNRVDEMNQFQESAGTGSDLVHPLINSKFSEKFFLSDDAVEAMM